MSKKAASVTLEAVVASVARELATSNTLDVRRLAAANQLRFRHPAPNSIWEPFVGTFKSFVQEARAADYPVRLFRKELPTKVVTSTKDAKFTAFLHECLKALASSDPRDAGWYEKRELVYQAVFELPIDPGPPRLSALRVDFVQMSTSLVRGTSASSPDAARSKVDAPPPPPPATTPTKETNMGLTFDLHKPESNKRTIFQYWVYDTATDEIAAQGSFIAKGDSYQEAVDNLQSRLSSELASHPSKNLKVHIRLVDRFEKPPAASTKTIAEQLIDAIKDEVRRDGDK